VLKVVGAGLPRTGTKSLQAALERLLGGRCYHMHEVFEHLGHVPVWRAALRHEQVDWESVLGDYSAAVDWPASAFWRELAEAYPSAIVILSVRSDAATWWDSVSSTILHTTRREPPPERVEWLEMLTELFERRLTPRWKEEPLRAAAAAAEAYDAHNAAVRAAVPPERLLEFRATDGWGPLCAALNVPVPDEPFPMLNTREEWWATHAAVAQETGPSYPAQTGS
jgi:hypothetical protein